MYWGGDARRIGETGEANVHQGPVIDYTLSPVGWHELVEDIIDKVAHVG